MIKNIYSVYDSKAEAWLQPFYCVNNAVAIRSFAHAANDAQHDFFRYAGDFALFELGTFEDSTSEIKSLQVPENLGLASIHKKDKDNR